MIRIPSSTPETGGCADLIALLHFVSNLAMNSGVNNMYFKTMAALAAATCVLAACGGGTGTGAAGGLTPTLTPTASGSATPVPAGTSFIQGAVDGTLRNGTVSVAGSWAGDTDKRSLTANTGDSPSPAVWSIQFLTPTVGSYTCAGGGNNTAVITFTDPSVVNPSDPMSALNMMVLTTGGGSCTVNVSAVSATEITGTFSATLKNIGGTFTRQVTGGSFTVAKSPA